MPSKSFPKYNLENISGAKGSMEREYRKENTERRISKEKYRRESIERKI
jgi:hypothetical protein